MKTDRINALTALRDLFLRYNAQVWFCVEEAWGMHDIDTHYYCVSIRGSEPLRVCCKSPYVHTPNMLICCQPYLADFNTEPEYWTRQRLTPPKGIEARFLRRLTKLLNKHNCIIRDSQIEIGQDIIQVPELRHQVMTSSYFDGLIRLQKHELTEAQSREFEQELSTLLHMLNARLVFADGKLDFTNGSEHFILSTSGVYQ